MTTIRANRINRQPVEFGKPKQIALQKAKEAGVINLTPIARAYRNRQSGFVQYIFMFSCTNPNCDHRLHNRSYQIQNQLYCDYCLSEYYIDSLGRIYELPQQTIQE